MKPQTYTMYQILQALVDALETPTPVTFEVFIPEFLAFLEDTVPLAPEK